MPADGSDSGPERGPRERPGWWPDDEQWPPREWRGPPWWGRRGGPGTWSTGGPWGPPWRHRGALARRFGCFVVLMSAVFVSVGVLVLWLLGSLLGIVSGAGGADAESPLGSLARVAALVVLVVGAVVIAFGIRLARSVGPPLADLAAAAERVEAGDYAVRVPAVGAGPGELRNLVRAFNTMAARLEVDEAQRRSLLADVSHELRTPLSVIQGNLEAIVDGVHPADEAHLATILEETRVLSRLIDDLRTLSLAEAGTLQLHREPTDLAILAAEVGRAFERRASSAGARLELAVEDDVPLLDVDPIRIREVLANLVANALRYVEPGGTVRIEGHVGAGTVDLAVVDDGPGIPAELLPSVFDRFAKSADSRGSGLGLAIARAIVEAHGGRIVAESSAGAGTTIRISLPAD